jgi:hypothetical protein
VVVGFTGLNSIRTEQAHWHLSIARYLVGRPEFELKSDRGLEQVGTLRHIRTSKSRLRQTSFLYVKSSNSQNSIAKPRIYHPCTPAALTAPNRKNGIEIPLTDLSHRKEKTTVTSRNFSVPWHPFAISVRPIQSSNEQGAVTCERVLMCRRPDVAGLL